MPCSILQELYFNTNMNSKEAEVDIFGIKSQLLLQPKSAQFDISYREAMKWPKIWNNFSCSRQRRSPAGLDMFADTILSMVLNRLKMVQQFKDLAEQFLKSIKQNSYSRCDLRESSIT